ncbi:MAG: NUDIX domain-containing protein [Caulobacteraceae bacterium]|nr:NUDIX domain-containing protein [Caulobacteraceae bacterium]
MRVPQFGEPQPGRLYRPRPAVFGVLERDGTIAVVRVSKPGHAPWIDLPGGALDPGEDGPQALIREFGEETGLQVRAGALVCRADQLFLNTDGEAFDNQAAFFETILIGKAPHLKIEEDHVLTWVKTVAALCNLRHESHAWAVAAWLRKRA